MLKEREGRRRDNEKQGAREMLSGHMIMLSKQIEKIQLCTKQTMCQHLCSLHSRGNGDRQ